MMLQKGKENDFFILIVRVNFKERGIQRIGNLKWTLMSIYFISQLDLKLSVGSE